jgi:hypothetical protein
MSEISYKALGDALERLREVLILLDAHRTDEFQVSMRNSVLLSFQFTYGLCRPMIERFLVDDGDDPLDIQEMSYAAIVRSANERGVVQADWATGASLATPGTGSPTSTASRSLRELSRRCLHC